MGRREALAADAVRHERLSALLARVLRTVPALRAHGVPPGDDPFATLARLPTMTKQPIRDDYRGHFAEDVDPRDCASVVTSGTTGVPLKIVHNAVRRIRLRH